MTEAMDKGWAVSVDVGGETVLTIGHNHLSGADNIEDYRETVINCAHHLLSFIGEPEHEASLLKSLEEAKAALEPLKWLTTRVGPSAPSTNLHPTKISDIRAAGKAFDVIDAALSSIQKDQK